MQKILLAVDGYKTYIGIGMGILGATVAYLTGGFDIAGTHIAAPADLSALLKIWWEGISFVFLRHGVAKSGPVTNQ